MPNPMGPWTRRMLGEEKLAALHWLLAIICFHFDVDWAAWIFAVRAGMDELLAIKAAYRAHKTEPDA